MIQTADEIDTGFDLHVDIEVTREGEAPPFKEVRVAKDMLRRCAQFRSVRLGRITQKWFCQQGQWLWVIGAPAFPVKQ